MCWFCYWGWPEPIVKIYLKAAADLGNERRLQYGPAHAVWCDANFDDSNINWAIEHFSEFSGEFTKKEKAIVRRSLIELRRVPEYLREIPDEYDGLDPADCPPFWPGIKMIKGL